MADLLLTRRARNDLSRLPAAVQSAVIDTLEMLAADPKGEGKPLRGRLEGLWTCRIGSYRVLYSVDDRRRGQLVIVRAIRHRGIAYGRG